MGQAWRTTHYGPEHAALSRGVALVVEPDLSRRQEVIGTLRSFGYQAHETGCGAVGQFIATQIEVDVAVINVVLPDMNALHLIKRVRALSPNALIMATSPNGDAWDATAGLAERAGANLALSTLSSEVIRRVVGGAGAELSAN
jgi:DNA-binding response OmpR family regulator